MKKIIACISLVFAMSAGVTAMAETVDNTDLAADNTVTVTSDATYNTVLIIDNADGKIVYVDQNDAGYAASAAANFLLKSDAGYGTYTMKRGSNSGATFEDVTITIEEPYSGPIDMGEAEYVWNYADGARKDVGFKLEAAESLTGLSKLIITATKNGEERSLTIDDAFPTISGAGAIDVAVKITQVPVDVTLSVSIGK